MDIKEIVEQMHTIIIPTADKQNGHFLQIAEDWYNVAKEMQQVLPHLFKGPMS